MGKRLLLILPLVIVQFLTVLLVSEVQAKVVKKLKVTSIPSGAEVFLKKGTREIAIGKTPFTYEAKFHSEMSVLRIVFKKKGYNDKIVKVKASENKVSAKLAGLKVTAKPGRHKDGKLSSLQKRINPIIDKTLPGLLQKEGKLDYNLAGPAQVKSMDNKKYVVVSILLQNLKDKFETKGKARQKELLESGWKQFGPSLVIPLAKALKGQQGLHGVVLDMNYDEKGFSFNVSSHVETSVEMECVPGYDQQYQYTTCWQNGSPYSCSKLVSVYNPCQSRRPVTKRKVVVDPKVGVLQGKALARYVVPLSHVSGKLLSYRKVAIVHKDAKGETTFTQGDVPGERAGKKGTTKKSGEYKERDLIVAAMDGKVNQVKSLLGQGFHVDSRDPNDYTPLMWAASKGHQEVVKLLLDKGGKVNARNNLGMTALMQAALSGETEMAKLLIDRGADVKIESDFGTALSIAKGGGSTEIVELLKEAGAE